MSLNVSKIDAGEQCLKQTRPGIKPALRARGQGVRLTLNEVDGNLSFSIAGQPSQNAAIGRIDCRGVVSMSLVEQRLCRVFRTGPHERAVQEKQGLGGR